ncbi:hypothetical protein [Paenibacillus sp. FSL L8-0463]|uniref:hypothetical protein n=1 Tax=Paenibacillus sp. FSL L8-0463 TaxID=2954687 RepID=UPI00311A1B2E
MGITLSNDILTVEIADLGAYKGTRFDWTGFITQVTLEQGKHMFCVPESLVPGQGTGGIGLCNEFSISRAIGYDDAEVGEWFPKPGVGLLQKQEDAPYFFAGSYPLIPFEVIEEHTTDSVTYSVQPMECRGYSMLLTKRISLDEDRLNISYTLENRGSKELRIEEYNHNFIGINGGNVGSGYELRLPGIARVEQAESSYTEELLSLTGDKLSWKNEPNRSFYCKLGGWEAVRDSFYWEITHRPSGAGIREYGNFQPDRMALWGEKHVISPEVFADISILPRHSKDWSRSYQFFTI